MQEQQHQTNHQNRTFICSCGKDYLSYPALFTHIKQKHSGKVSHYLFQAPGPIERPRSDRKRGRPRKNLLKPYTINQNSYQPKEESEFLESQISILNEINKKYISSLEVKGKKAAELLGCGNFQAFRIYTPELTHQEILRFQKETISLKDKINFNELLLENSVENGRVSSFEPSFQSNEERAIGLGDNDDSDASQRIREVVEEEEENSEDLEFEEINYSLDLLHKAKQTLLPETINPVENYEAENMGEIFLQMKVSNAGESDECYASESENSYDLQEQNEEVAHKIAISQM